MRNVLHPLHNENEFLKHLDKCKTKEQLFSPLTFALVKYQQAEESQDIFLDDVRSAAFAMKVPSVEYEIAQWINRNSEPYCADPDRFVKAALENAPTKKKKLLLPASSFEPRSVRYLVEPYIPRGAVTILGGISGTGKTSLALSLAAAISSGSRLPFEPAWLQREPESVVYLTMENDPNVVLRPRIEAMGADLDRVFFLDGVGTSMTSAELRDAVREVKAAMMVFDPIQSFLPSGTQMGRAEQIRPIVDKVTEVSKDEDLGSVFISHMSKPGPGVVSALDRLLGSSDFRNVARSVLIVGRDPENPNQRVFAHAKNSYGLPAPAQRYHISDGGLVVFDGEADLTADQIIAQTENAAPRAKKAANTLNEAIDTLDKALGFVGWVDVATVYALSAAGGYSDRTMRNAKAVMGLKVLKVGMQPNQKTYWYRGDLSEDSVKADILNQNEPLTFEEASTLEK